MKRLLILLFITFLFIPMFLANGFIVQAKEVDNSISITQIEDRYTTISSPPVCTWSAENHVTTYELIKPFCGTGSSIWAGIRSRAVYTGSTGKVKNYNASGGSNAAIREFNKMPGTRSTKAGGVLIKTHSGKAVTYYPRSKSTDTPTLQYPTNKGPEKLEKIRYYD